MKKNRNKKTAFKMQKNKRRRKSELNDSYEAMEPRRVLAALFPAYINGTLTLGDSSGASPYPLADTFELESRPGADKVIYLDFDGHHSVDNAWGHDIVFPAFDRDGDSSNFSDAELIEIQKNFQNVSEDFFAFNVNVTTKDPGLEYLTKVGGSDTTYGIRNVCTQATDGFGGFGGIAYLNSFDDNIDNPCFSLNKGVNVGAMTQSHEVGHTLGLRHDGLNGSSYHPGGGSGETSWGPIMGAPFSANVTQWSPGDYDGADNFEDDYAVITKNANGFDFRDDDYGSTIASASPLEMEGDVVFQWGNIERQTDVDMFEFTTGSGMVTFDINPFQENPNLDIQATLFDSDGSVVATSNPADQLNAAFNLSLDSGTYFLGIEGVGLPGGYSEYGSIGFYTIEGTVISVNGVGIGEAGHVTITDEWATVALDGTYENPVVVMGPASRNGGDVLTVRVDNVTATSFDVQLDEWDYRDGRHVPETVSYMVFEEGEYILLDGTKLRAGTGESGGRWKTYDLSESIFDSTPLIFSQVMTTNGEEAVTTRVRNPGASSFQLRVQEQQANSPQRHVNETVGYVAITPGAGAGGDFVFEAGTTGLVVTSRPHQLDFTQSFSDAPVLLTAMQSHTGGDPATVRLREALTADHATIFIEEERSHDNEMRHNAEDVGYLAISPGEILGDEQDGGEPPEFMRVPGYTPGYAGLPGYYSTDTPQLWAALAEMESWGDEVVSDANHNDPCCTCNECISSIGNELGLQNAVFNDGFDRVSEESENRSTLGTSAKIDDLAGSVDQELNTNRDFLDSIFGADNSKTSDQESWHGNIFDILPR